MDDLRQTGLLKNLGAMDAYCWQHGGSITEDRRSYGYIAETENYRFCLRCTPFPGEYQGYLYCYDLCQQEMYRQEHPVVGRVTFASGEQQEFTDSKALLQAIREELPFRSTTGFRFETLTDDPEVKKAVDDILLDFAGEDNSRRTCNYGLTETGKQALMRAGCWCSVQTPSRSPAGRPRTSSGWPMTALDAAPTLSVGLSAVPAWAMESRPDGTAQTSPAF